MESPDFKDSDPPLAAGYLRAIFAVKTAGLLLILLGYLVIEFFVSPFGHWILISTTVLASLVPTVALAALSGQLRPWLLRASLGVDAVALTVGIHLGGGIENVSMPLLYMAGIVLAGLLLTPADTMAVALVSVLLYDLMVLGEYSGMLPHLVPYSRPPARQLGTAIPVNLFLLLFAWLFSYATSKVRATYRRLEQHRRESVRALSHDLRNTLAIIHGYAQLLPEVPAEEQSEIIPLLERNALQALDLVANILDAAAFDGRYRAPRLRSIALNEIVGEVVDRYRSSARACGIALTTDLAPSLPVIPLDPQMIGRAVSNLVSNAIKFTPKEGRVRVSTGCNGDGIHICVDDSGPGIPPEERALLFREFSRTTSGDGVEGSGLDLYIVSRVVEAHGGSVDVDSMVGDGSKFTVSLPLRNDSSGAAEK